MSNIDPRFIMADTLDILRKAGIDNKSFWDEINTCEGADDAVEICHRYQDMVRTR